MPLDAILQKYFPFHLHKQCLKHLLPAVLLPGFYDRMKFHLNKFQHCKHRYLKEEQNQKKSLCRLIL